jgi:hypothetical protein
MQMARWMKPRLRRQPKDLNVAAGTVVETILRRSTESRQTEASARVPNLP